MPAEHVGKHKILPSSGRCVSQGKLAGEVYPHPKRTPKPKHRSAIMPLTGRGVRAPRWRFGVAARVKIKEREKKDRHAGSAFAPPTTMVGVHGLCHLVTIYLRTRLSPGSGRERRCTRTVSRERLICYGRRGQSYGDRGSIRFPCGCEARATLFSRLGLMHACAISTTATKMVY